MKPPPDCLCCGACCFSPSEKFVRVTGDDWSRLGAEADRVARFIGNQAFMRMSAGHCAALEIRGNPGAPQFFCTIYGQRPQICRDLARGSRECVGERTKDARKRIISHRGTESTEVGANENNPDRSISVPSVPLCETLPNSQ